MSYLPTKITVFLLFSLPLRPQTSNSGAGGGYILLVFTMTNKPIEIVFHSAAMAAAGMRREENSSSSLHHLIKHTLYRAVLMKTTYMSSLNLLRNELFPSYPAITGTFSLV